MSQSFGRRQFLVLSAVAASPAVVAVGQSAASAATAGDDVGTEYQQTASVREELSFNNGWRFLRGDAPGAEEAGFGDSAWESVDVPHAVRLEPVDVGGRNYQGVAWYRRHFPLDAGYRGRRLFIRFEGAMQVAQVWLNGTLIGEHQGGYTPFVLDVTDHALLGGVNVLAVRLDNTDDPLVPPGKPQAGLDMDYFGGLYRDVTLTAVDPLHISDAVFAGKVAGGGVFVTTPQVGVETATVGIATDVRNDAITSADTTVTSVIVDADGRVVAQATTSGSVPGGGDMEFTQSVTVDRPNLWSPDAPYLYTLYSEVHRSANLVDRIGTPFGIRSISWTKADGFAINGTHLLINGTDRGHQEYPYVGYAAPASQQRRDALLIKESGANFVRSAHYPPHPAFLDACDELGLMVMDSIPGWQFWNDDPRFQDNSFNDTRTMIRRDRNHPSVVLWEVSLNETSVPEAYARAQVAITHAEYPGSQAFAYGGNTTNTGTIFDVQNADTITPGPAALLYREYGDYDFGGEDSTSRSTRADGQQAMLVSAANKQQDYSRLLDPANWPGAVLAGIATWSASDYNRGLNQKTCHSGLYDLFRIPKFVYYFYQSQRDPQVRRTDISSGPMAYIANWWTKPEPPYVTWIGNGTQGSGTGQFGYTGTGWQSIGQSNAYDDSVGDSVTLRFQGNQITLHSTVNYLNGIGAVSIDGGPDTDVDFYNSGFVDDQAVWTSPVLTEGDHTFTLKVTGRKNAASQGTWVSLVGVDVTSSLMPPQQVKVFSNCDTVRLHLNDSLIAEQKPDSGPNTVNVLRPPFTFGPLDFAPGTLRADGIIDGRIAASHTVRTPGPAERIAIDIDLPGGQLTADGIDFAVARFSLLDANGTTVPTNGTDIAVTVAGDGGLIGDASIGANPVPSQAGIAAALIRATHQPGTITITAHADGLTPGHATIRTQPSTTPRSLAV